MDQRPIEQQKEQNREVDVMKEQDNDNTNTLELLAMRANRQEMVKVTIEDQIRLEKEATTRKLHVIRVSTENLQARLEQEENRYKTIRPKFEELYKKIQKVAKVMKKKVETLSTMKDEAIQLEDCLERHQEFNEALNLTLPAHLLKQGHKFLFEEFKKQSSQIKTKIVTSPDQPSTSSLTSNDEIMTSHPRDIPNPEEPSTSSSISNDEVLTVVPRDIPNPQQPSISSSTLNDEVMSPNAEHQSMSAEKQVDYKDEGTHENVWYVPAHMNYKFVEVCQEQTNEFMDKLSKISPLHQIN